MVRLTSLAALALALVLAPAPASAQGGPGTELLSFWLVLDPGPDGIGVGGRYMFPLAEGVVRHPRIRDEFALELGVDFLHYGDSAGFPPYDFDYSWNGLLFAVGASWNFWLTPKFALYPKLDLGFVFGWYDGWDDQYGYSQHDYGGLYLEPAIGLIYAFGRANLRVELGTDLARIGLGFAY